MNELDLPSCGRGRGGGCSQVLSASGNGLGAQFLDEFDRSVAEILETPERWRIIKDDKRRYLMARFPFGLYYRIAGDDVRVLVVKHHSQHPDYGMGRT